MVYSLHQWRLCNHKIQIVTRVACKMTQWCTIYKCGIHKKTLLIERSCSTMAKRETGYSLKRYYNCPKTCREQQATYKLAQKNLQQTFIATARKHESCNKKAGLCWHSKRDMERSRLLIVNFYNQSHVILSVLKAVDAHLVNGCHRLLM
jgi:hypothetical protein